MKDEKTAKSEKPFVSEYKGSKILNLPTGSEFKPTFGFGVKKAQLIVKYIKDIEKFAKENASEKGDE